MLPAEKPQQGEVQKVGRQAGRQTGGQAGRQAGSCLSMASVLEGLFRFSCMGLVQG